MKKKTEPQNEKSGNFKPGAAMYTATTYSQDRPLFKKLGLLPFTDIPSNTSHYVGKVKLKNGSVANIWVHPAPAQFWKIEIHFASSDRKVKVSTGSGALTDFWESIQLIADGMLVIE